MGTDTLFEQHTIKEIQEIEKKLRNDIEKKKEELRQMVGERYRDLMEAADTITEMKEIAESVTSHIKAMEDHCVRLQHSSLQSGILNTVKLKAAERKKKNETLYAVASMIKILMDTPAKIWASVESEDYLRAMLLYLLARHTHSLLLLDPLYSEQGIFHHFPIISKQWTSIRHFQHILLQKCQHMLQSETVDAENVVGSLCCIVFLSDSSPEQIFQEVLSTRKVAVLNVFKPEKYAKDQVCELAAMLQNTLKIIHAVFYPDAESTTDHKTNLLFHTLDRITSKDFPGPVSLLDVQSSPPFRYLPKSVTDFRPVLIASNSAINVESLQTKCEQWLLELIADMKNSLKDLLKYVNSIKGLALIRDAVLDQLSQDTYWDIVCNDLLKSSFCIWNTFLRPIFCERIKDIISDQVEFSSSVCQKDVDESLKELCIHDKSTSKQSNFSVFVEKDVSSYVWMESTSDLTSNLGWVPYHQRHLWDGGTLGMKAYGLTPKVQSICKSVDQKLRNLIEDVAHFTPNEKLQEGWISDKGLSPQRDTPKHAVFCADTQPIHSHLTKVTEKCFFNLSQSIQNILLTLENEDMALKLEITTRVVFLGHLCHGLTMLCPHLMQCLLQENAMLLPKQPSSLTTFTSSATKDDQLWQKLKLKLLELNDYAFRIWSKLNVSDCAKKFESNLVVCSVTGILKSLLQWDKVEIQEESEEGNSVKSVLRIPQQVSLPLYNTLFNFCCELNKTGGHALSSHIRSHIREELLSCLLKVYQTKENTKWPEDTFSPRLAQTQSLQLLFDVQFLMGLMGSPENPDDPLSAISKEIVAKLVSHIDPFDMDVFSSPLQINLRRSLQKSLLLLGLVASPEQVGHLNSLKAHPPSAPMEHNLMLMSNVTSRFPLLPLAVRTTSTILKSSDSIQSPDFLPKESPLKSSRSHNSSPNLSASDSSGSVFKSASFYDRVSAMSSSWFGGS